jgi:hypothetical protein
MAFLAPEHLGWYSLLAPHKMVSLVGAPTSLEVIAIKFCRFSVVLHRETIVPGEVPVRNLGSPVRANPNSQTGSSMAYTQALQGEP